MTVWEKAQEVAPLERVAIATIEADNPVVQGKWTDMINSLKEYHRAQTAKAPGVFHNTAKRNAKRDAALSLLKILANNSLLNHEGVEHIEPTHAAGTAPTNEMLSTRIQRAGAMARAYISEFPDVVAGTFHHRLYDILTTIIAAQKACITGDFINLSMRPATRA